MSNPKVSVIMSTYNEDIEWLSLAVESILNQTFRDFEFIIVLDNPKRIDIKDLLVNYRSKDNRVFIIENENNCGLIKSLNKALAVAKSEYIARMDADDIAYPDRLQVQYDYMQKNNEVDLIGSRARYIDENGKTIDLECLITTRHEAIKRLLLYSNAFSHPTWFFRKKILNELKGYREVPLAEDYDFVTRVITSGYKVGNVDKILLDYRIRSNGISQSNNFKQIKTADMVVKMYKARLNGKSDAILFDNLQGYMNSDKGKLNYEKALVYKKKSKESKGINKIWQAAKSILCSSIHAKLMVDRKKYIYYYNKEEHK